MQSMIRTCHLSRTQGRSIDDVFVLSIWNRSASRRVFAAGIPTSRSNAKIIAPETRVHLTGFLAQDLSAGADGRIDVTKLETEASVGRIALHALLASIQAISPRAAYRVFQLLVA